jgi:hypothetical protein
MPNGTYPFSYVRKLMTPLWVNTKTPVSLFNFQDARWGSRDRRPRLPTRSYIPPTPLHLCDPLHARFIPPFAVKEVVASTGTDLLSTFLQLSASLLDLQQVSAQLLPPSHLLSFVTNIFLINSPPRSSSRNLCRRSWEVRVRFHPADRGRGKHSMHVHLPCVLGS